MFMKWQVFAAAPRIHQPTPPVSRMLGLHQAATGDEPAVVRTLQQAYAALGIDEPDRQPVDMG
jgi:hypothetical protein